MTLDRLDWCLKCEDAPVPSDDKGNGGCINDHPKFVVQIRGDIVHDALKRLAKDLHRTNRLVYVAKI